MVSINKQEAEVIRGKFGDKVAIIRTSKQKSQRHRYFMAEEVFAMRYLEQFRNKDAKRI